jgi:phosphoribosylaminoimidazolecarboxamide formyltransferase / IMP cyclohydrolase
MKRIERAIISVTDKTGIVDFAASVAGLGIQILSTGGTAEVLRNGNIPVVEISDYTEFPEMLDGRVKTLHPRVHGALLGVRDNPEHVKLMNAHGIKNIDLVVVNLYQFEKAIAEAGATLEKAIENIDIGGPAMLRSSAKNYKYVTVVTDPSDYECVLSEMRTNGGATTLQTRFRLARKVFQLTSRYDRAISVYLEEVENQKTL